MTGCFYYLQGRLEAAFCVPTPLAQRPPGGVRFPDDDVPGLPLRAEHGLSEIRPSRTLHDGDHGPALLLARSETGGVRLFPLRRRLQLRDAA